MLCPCQHHKQNIKKTSFEDCCQPIITHDKEASTPELLMRSRYSAYATKNAEYILNTYSEASAKKQSLDDIQQWADACKWVNLIIHSPISDDNDNLNKNEVEFSAYYIEDKQLCMIRERSQFIEESTAPHSLESSLNDNNSRWVYHDGIILQNEVCSKVKRNELCPCQSGKKFKACCHRFL